MKITAILKNLSSTFFDGNDYITGFNTRTPKEQFEYITGSSARDLGITIKIGSGSFRDRVELNQMLRTDRIFTSKLEPRKGYKLVTFEVS